MKEIDNNTIAKFLMLHREFFFAGVEPLIGKNADRLVQNNKLFQWQNNSETSKGARELKEKHLQEIRLFYQNVDTCLRGINIYKQNFIRRILWNAHLQHYRNAVYYKCGLRSKEDFLLANTQITNRYYQKASRYLLKHPKFSAVLRDSINKPKFSAAVNYWETNTISTEYAGHIHHTDDHQRLLAIKRHVDTIEDAMPLMNIKDEVNIFIDRAVDVCNNIIAVLQKDNGINIVRNLFKLETLNDSSSSQENVDAFLADLQRLIENNRIPVSRSLILDYYFLYPNILAETNFDPRNPASILNLSTLFDQCLYEGLKVANTIPEFAPRQRRALPQVTQSPKSIFHHYPSELLSSVASSRQPAKTECPSSSKSYVSRRYPSENSSPATISSSEKTASPTQPNVNLSENSTAEYINTKKSRR